MPRRLRIEFPGGVYHVFNRGVLQQDIVRSDSDRQEWFRLFDRVATRCQWRVMAHVLMTNHFHLFVKLTGENLAIGMHDLQSGYATLFNKDNQRDGVVFEGRYKAILVESLGHAWALSRYLHLNPCRSGLAARPEHYEWSTYRWFLNPTQAPKWLDWQSVLNEFGGTEGAARIAYRRYVEQALKQPTENPFDKVFEDSLLGSPEFIAAHRHLLADEPPTLRRNEVTLSAILESVAKDFQTDEIELTRRGRHSNVAREVALWLGRETSCGSLSELAEAFGISKSTASSTIKQCESRQAASQDLRDRCQRLKKNLLENSR